MCRVLAAVAVRLPATAALIFPAGANPSTHHCCRWTAEDDAELSVEAPGFWAEETGKPPHHSPAGPYQEIQDRGSEGRGGPFFGKTGSVLPGRGDSKQFCSSVVGQGSRDLESWVEGLEGRDRTDWTWLSVFHSFGFGKVSCWRMHDAALGFAQEEPRLNFDTNVIGPTNANIIGGAGASPLQERAQSRCCHVDKLARKRSCSVWVCRAALAATGS